MNFDLGLFLPPVFGSSRSRSRSSKGFGVPLERIFDLVFEEGLGQGEGGKA